MMRPWHFTLESLISLTFPSLWEEAFVSLSPTVWGREFPEWHGHPCMRGWWRLRMEIGSDGAAISCPLSLVRASTGKGQWDYFNARTPSTGHLCWVRFFCRTPNQRWLTVVFLSCHPNFAAPIPAAGPCFSSYLCISVSLSSCCLSPPGCWLLFFFWGGEGYWGSE